MGSKVKRALQLAAIGGIMAGTMVLPTTAAHALPSNCSDIPYGNGWMANCNKGTGTFRAWARCYKIGRDTYTTRYGAWRTPVSDLVSIATCQSSEEVGGGGRQVQ
ncbi:hypothetical protein [Nonomuraea cavernae]|uniref:hypothetical protein n=1 Tax=Nonomuraea cavernae TaxID=2045107 RepID=UPI0033FB4AA3